MSSITSNIRLVCFVRGETVKDIFPVVIDDNLIVENLGDEIKNVRKDLSQKTSINTKNFSQENVALVSITIGLYHKYYRKKTGVLMDPQTTISQYFSVEDIKRLEENPPYPQYDER